MATWIERTGGFVIRDYAIGDRVARVSTSTGEIVATGTIFEVFEGIDETLYRLRYPDGHRDSVRRSARVLRPVNDRESFD